MNLRTHLAARIRLVSLTGLLALPLAGCSVLHSNPPAHLFMLESVAPPQANSANPGRPLVMVLVNPASVPEYLDRQQIVSKTSANELHLDDANQWAERLSINVARTLAAELSNEVPADAFIASPSRNAAMPIYQVSLNLDALELDPSGAALLAGRWAIENGDGTRELASAKVVRQEPSGSGAAQNVAAMSRNLDAVSRDIAAHLQQLIAAGPPPSTGPAR